MKNKNYSKMLLLATLTFSSVSYVNSQVTIGADNAPQNFSVLELISNNIRGLRLPQLTTEQRDTVQVHFGSHATAEAMGLTIFNTDTRCVETWNGVEWIMQCDCGNHPCNTNPCAAPAYTSYPFTTFPTDAAHTVTLNFNRDAINNTDSILTFLTYNLGADPNLTVKQQMQPYDVLFPSCLSKDTIPYITNVMGGLFQWGRSSIAHSSRVKTLPYSPYTAPVSALDGNGQPTGDDADKFIYFNDAAAHNWRSTLDENLWRGINGGAGNPAPSGFRVPTAAEWTMLINEWRYLPGSIHGSYHGEYTDVMNETKYVWVPVIDGKIHEFTEEDISYSSLYNDTYYSNIGYAIYLRTDLPFALLAESTDLLDNNVTTATPVLYLPAAGGRIGDNAITDNAMLPSLSGQLGPIGECFYASSDLYNDGGQINQIRFCGGITCPPCPGTDLYPISLGSSIRCVAQ